MPQDHLNMPLLANLPAKFASKIVKLEPVDVGSHTIFRCFLDSQSADVQESSVAWYLKSVKSTSQIDGMFIEISVNQAIQAVPAINVNIGNLLWSSECGKHILLSEVTGVSATNRDIVKHIDSLLIGLTTIHQCPTERLTLPTWEVAELHREINRLDSNLTDKNKLLKVYTSIETALQYEHFGLVHGDLNAGNVMFDNHAKRWGLLDWECAQIADVRWDLASICVEYEMSATDSKMIFNKYAKLINVEVDQFTKDRQSWISFYRLTCLVWALKNNYPETRYLI